MKPKVIYIAGYGRSGSTILDILLGQHPEIFGAGEISTILRHVWPNNEYCACGDRVRGCPFWSDVIADWTGQGHDPQEVLALQQQLEPARLLRRPRGSGSDRAAYAAQALALYQAVLRRSGRSFLVDSSKNPVRGQLLAASGAVDLYVIHLVRDARAVAHSMAKTMPVDLENGVQKEIRPRPALWTALRWNQYNRLSEQLARQAGPERALRVRYEDFAADPGAVLLKAGQLTGLDMQELAAQARAGAAFGAGHQVAGSRIRMAGPRAIRLDTAWKQRIAPAMRRQVQLAAFPGLRRYGYLSQD